MTRVRWTEEAVQAVRAQYSNNSTKEIARNLGRTTQSVYVLAQKLGLSKSKIYLSSPAACRLRRGGEIGRNTRFQPGEPSWNKGRKLPNWTRGRMAETQFKPGARQGVAAKNWCPVGTIRADSDGFLRIKVREGTKGEAYGFGNVRIWPQLNRHNWESHHGPIPAGHAVVFKDGNRANCDLANLECISRGELMKRNTIHNLPKGLVEVIQLQGVLKRRLRSKHEELAGRSA